MLCPFPFFQIVHKELCTRHILLGENYEVKVSGLNASKGTNKVDLFLSFLFFVTYDETLHFLVEARKDIITRTSFAE